METMTPGQQTSLWLNGTNLYYRVLEQIIKRHFEIIETYAALEPLNTRPEQSFRLYLDAVKEWLLSISQSWSLPMLYTKDGLEKLWLEIRENPHKTQFIFAMVEEFYLSDIFKEEGSTSRFFSRLGFAGNSVTHSETIKHIDQQTFQQQSQIHLTELLNENPWLAVYILLTKIEVIEKHEMVTHRT